MLLHDYSRATGVPPYTCAHRFSYTRLLPVMFRNTTSDSTRWNLEKKKKNPRMLSSANHPKTCAVCSLVRCQSCVCHHLQAPHRLQNAFVRQSAARALISAHQAACPVSAAAVVMWQWHRLELYFLTPCLPCEAANTPHTEPQTHSVGRGCAQPQRRITEPTD